MPGTPAGGAEGAGVSGMLGGMLAGGGGTCLSLLLLLPPSSPGGLETRVKVFSSRGSSLPNSAHGITMCPDGAISPWKDSVPGGSALRKS